MQKSKDERPRLTGGLAKLVKSLKSKKENRVLVIGDLHEPFCLDRYLKHCKEVYEKYNCNKVVFIGDIIDNHYSSYHETDSEGYGGGDELELAIKRLKRWYKAFPEAIVTIGNHDRIIMRKAQTGGIPKKWIRNYEEVLETPGWRYVETYELDDVVYVHGDGAGQARSRFKKELTSLVMGHFHTAGYIEWAVGRNFKIFGMQVGCGIDHEQYAFAYGKAYGKPFVSCGVILENGTLPILEPMKL